MKEILPLIDLEVVDDLIEDFPNLSGSNIALMKEEVTWINENNQSLGVSLGWIVYELTGRQGFDPVEFKLGALVTHRLIRLSREYNEEPLIPINQTAINDYYQYLERLKMLGNAGFFVTLCREVEKTCPGLIRSIFPQNPIPVAGILGITNVLFPWQMTLEKPENR